MKHFTGLAHIALYTNNLDTSVAFYTSLGGTVTGHAEVKKAMGTNRITMIQLPGFYLEIIEPHDGSPVTANGGLFPHIAIEVDDIDSAIEDLKALGIHSFRTESSMDLPIFGGIRNIFFQGPDGEQIELLQHVTP